MTDSRRAVLSDLKKSTDILWVRRRLLCSKHKQASISERFWVNSTVYGPQMKQEKLQYTRQETMFMNPILYGTENRLIWSMVGSVYKRCAQLRTRSKLRVFFKRQPLNKSIKLINTSRTDIRAVYVNIIALKNLISCDSKHKWTRAH